MDREILFRGKRVDNGEWVEGDLLHGYCAEKSTDIASIDISCTVEVIPETVGQYTGLTDESGKKIFEGDIVTGLFNFGLIINSICEFNDGSFGLKARQCGAEHFHPFTSMCNISYDVIGNIHDNPELLEVSE